MKKGKIYLIRERFDSPIFVGLGLDDQEVISYLARVDRVNEITYDLTVLARNPGPDPAPIRRHKTHLSADGGTTVELDTLIVTQFDLDGGDMLVTEVTLEYLPTFVGWPWKSPEFDKILKGEK